MSAASPQLRLASSAGRWTLLATVLGSGMASVDSTVVNIALPHIGRDLGGGLADLQWTVNAYALTLASLLILAGSLGDRFGRRRMFVAGVAWFTVGSVLCALAPTIGALIGARALQGCGAALLVPESLAILEASFRPEDRGAAIGAWSGLSGVAVALGPLLGGWLVQAATWRWIFLINVPLAAVVAWIALRHMPETRDVHAAPPLDLPGAVLTALGLAGVTYALTEHGRAGSNPVAAATAAVGGALALAALGVLELRSSHPMLPRSVLRSRQFVAANVVTLIVYAALGGSIFLLPLVLQRVLGLSPLQAGAALAPVTLILLLLSAGAGRLSGRIGPRIPMTIGPIVAGVGLALLMRVRPGSHYLPDVLPALIVFGLGLSLTVAPLTATVLAAIRDEQAGLASAINNAVSRTAGLIAVAALPAAAGLTTSALAHPAQFAAGFDSAMAITGGMCVVGGIAAALTIRNPGRTSGRGPAALPHCALDAAPLRSRAHRGGGRRIR